MRVDDAHRGQGREKGQPRGRGSVSCNPLDDEMGGRTWVLEAWAVENNSLSMLSLSLSLLPQHLPHPLHLAAHTYTQTQARTPPSSPPLPHRISIRPRPPLPCSDLKGTVPVFDTCRVRDSLVLSTATGLSFSSLSLSFRCPARYVCGDRQWMDGAAARSVLRVVG